MTVKAIVTSFDDVKLLRPVFSNPDADETHNFFNPAVLYHFCASICHDGEENKQEVRAFRFLVFFKFTSDTSKLLIMAFVYLVDFPLRGDHIMSLEQ